MAISTKVDTRYFDALLKTYKITGQGKPGGWVECGVCVSHGVPMCITAYVFTGEVLTHRERGRGAGVGRRGATALTSFPLYFLSLSLLLLPLPPSLPLSPPPCITAVSLPTSSAVILRSHVSCVRRAVVTTVLWGEGGREVGSIQRLV